jgi:DnaJ-class molecular chaperone
MTDELERGDEVPPDAPSSGEDVCAHCDGSGEVDGTSCPECGGSGRVEEAIGGG